MQFGIIGSGSWATALAKILTDNGNTIYWWVRNEAAIKTIQQRRHNPHYLHTAYFNTSQLILEKNLNKVIEACNVLVIAVPSAYVEDAFNQINENALQNKKIMSAVKGILPAKNLLVNDYLKEKFNVLLENYFTILGP